MIKPHMLMLFTVHADKEYRKAIHWLETLRLRRMKTMENGYKVRLTCPPQKNLGYIRVQSLEMFVHESSMLLKAVLEKYSDNMMCVYRLGLPAKSHDHFQGNIGNAHSTRRSCAIRCGTDQTRCGYCSD